MTALPSDMRAVGITRFGGPEVLSLGEEELPTLARRRSTGACGGGRREPARTSSSAAGLYPPPPGATEVPASILPVLWSRPSADVNWPRGRQRGSPAAWSPGGGYAEYCSVPAVQCMSIPQGYDFAQACSAPEVLFTCWNNAHSSRQVAEGEALSSYRVAPAVSAWRPSRSQSCVIGACSPRASGRKPSAGRSVAISARRLRSTIAA